MFANVDYNPAHFGQFMMNCLAVLGGFLLGYLFAALIANLADRTIFHRKTPRLVHRALRILGGIALAFFVAGIVFSHGHGWNLFGGGSDGTGNANDTGSPQLISTTAPSPEKPVPPTSERIRITILGGTDVKVARFYLIDDDSTPHTLAEVKEWVMKQKAVAKPTLEIRNSSRNSLPSDHPAMLMLERMAREAGVGTDFPDGR